MRKPQQQSWAGMKIEYLTESKTLNHEHHIKSKPRENLHFYNTQLYKQLKVKLNKAGNHISAIEAG